MSYTWIVRPNPHGKNRLKEFLEKNIVAIGWPNIGDLSEIKSRSEIKKVLLSNSEYGSNYKLGQDAGNIYRFINKIEKDEYVIVPDGPIVYIGKIKSDYQYQKDLDNDDEGYPHQREVEWFHDKKGVRRNLLTGRVFDSLKGQQTVFTTYYEDVKDFVENKAFLFNENSYVDLKEEYLKRLQKGVLSNVNSSTFEEAVKTLLDRYYPGIERLATTNSEEGDTDLMVELPGDVIIRVQVKHFYTNRAELGSEVVDQLVNSMDSGDNGIIVTSGIISDEAIEYSGKFTDKSIGFIDGRQFVEMLFGSIDELPSETLSKFGLTHKMTLI